MNGSTLLHMPYDRALLIKRTAWRNMQPRKPSAEDEKYVSTAIRMLTYIACLNYAMCDLEGDLRDAGLFRHRAKRAFAQSQRIVQQVHQRAYEMLGRISATAARQYNDKLEEAWQSIDASILLAPPERAYNIVVALCRLIESANRRLTGRYDFAPARALYRIPSTFEEFGLLDREIDRIIELSIINK